MQKTLKISIYHPNAISLAKSILDHGGLIAFPTDTVYGLAAQVNNPDSIGRIYEVKSRDMLKAIPVLIGSKDQIPLVASTISSSAYKLIDCFWPGALTIIVGRHPNLPKNLSTLQTIGIRMPANPFTVKLLKHTGPLAVTSANISGRENPQTAMDVTLQLGGTIDLILDGGATPGNIPSTVVDCTSEPIKILRQGRISSSDIQSVL